MCQEDGGGVTFFVSCERVFVTLNVTRLTSRVRCRGGSIVGGCSQTVVINVFYFMQIRCILKKIAGSWVACR